MSSTYLFQQGTCSDKVWIKLFSNSTINIPYKTGPNSEHIATPLVWTYVLPWKLKCSPFVHSKISSPISFLVVDVLIFLLSYIRFRIISMMVSRGTFVKRDTTSNETILWPSRTFWCLMKLIKLLVLFIWFLLKGNSNFARCLESWSWS